MTLCTNPRAHLRILELSLGWAKLDASGMPAASGSGSGRRTGPPTDSTALTLALDSRQMTLMRQALKSRDSRSL